MPVGWASLPGLVVRGNVLETTLHSSQVLLCLVRRLSFLSSSIGKACACERFLTSERVGASEGPKGVSFPEIVRVSKVVFHPLCTPVDVLGIGDLNVWRE